MATPQYDLDTLDSAAIADTEATIRAAITALGQGHELGTGILHDVVVWLEALLATAAEQDVEALRDGVGLSVVQASPDSVDQDLVDAYLSNYRVVRNPGKTATGQVAVVLTAQRSVVVTSGSIWTAADGSRFLATSTFTARTAPEEVVDDTDRLLLARGSGWYFLIDVEAEETGTAGNLSSGAALTPSRTPSRFSHAYAQGSFTGGQDPETNAAALARLASGAALQAWGSRSSLESLLRVEFPSLLHLSVIGAGDTEMLRDRHGIFPVSQGGRTDAWLRREPLYRTKVVAVTALLVAKAGAVGTWQVTVGRDMAPGFYDVQKALLPSQDLTASGFAITQDTRGYDLSGVTVPPDVTSALEAAYTRYQTSVVRFDDAVTNATALTVGVATASYLLVFRVVPDLDVAQDWLMDRTRRPLASDVLVRAPVPVFAEAAFDLVLSIGSSAPDLDAVRAAVSAAVHATGFTDRLSASTIAQAVHALVPSATIDDVVLEGTLRKPSGANVSLSGTQTLQASSDAANMVTSRTVVFYLREEDVDPTIVYV